MAHFAKLDSDNVVVNVIRVDDKDILDENGIESEAVGIAFCQNLTGGGVWKQTSYNHNIRKNFAGIGYKYDPTRDAFIPPKPIDFLESLLGEELGTYIFNEDTCRWEPAPDANVSLKPSVLQNYPNEVFIESGTWMGHGVESALACGFNKIYSIELDPFAANRAKTIFANEISANVVEIIEGDSSVVFPQLMQQIDRPATIWLDAHLDGDPGYQSNTTCPLLSELDAISNSTIKTHTILIDDISVFNGYRRSLGSVSYWGEQITEDEIKNKILTINPQYTFSYDRGYIPNDILVARVV